MVLVARELLGLIEHISAFFGLSFSFVLVQGNVYALLFGSRLLHSLKTIKALDVLEKLCKFLPLFKLLFLYNFIIKMQGCPRSSKVGI